MNRSTAPLGISAGLNVTGGGLSQNVIQVVVDPLACDPDTHAREYTNVLPYTHTRTQGVCTPTHSDNEIRSGEVEGVNQPTYDC